MTAPAVRKLSITAVGLGDCNRAAASGRWWCETYLVELTFTVMGTPTAGPHPRPGRSAASTAEACVQHLGRPCVDHCIYFWIDPSSRAIER